MSQNLGLWAAVLLLVGGLMLVIPQLYGNLTELTGGTPWMQMLIGALSVIVALVLFAGGKNEHPSA
jgi:thiosulfate reductase cytochrome b subunit